MWALGTWRPPTETEGSGQEGSASEVFQSIPVGVKKNLSGRPDQMREDPGMPETPDPVAAAAALMGGADSVAVLTGAGISTWPP